MCAKKGACLARIQRRLHLMTGIMFLTPITFRLLYGRIAPRFVRLDVPKFRILRLSYRSETGAGRGDQPAKSCVRLGFKICLIQVAVGNQPARSDILPTSEKAAAPPSEIPPAPPPSQSVSSPVSALEAISEVKHSTPFSKSFSPSHSSPFSDPNK